MVLQYLALILANTVGMYSAYFELPGFTGIPKLDDANNAGGRSSDKCTLILTEGDSAKTLAISGLSVVGRDNYGVFPLRGKLLNVREATTAQVKSFDWFWTVSLQRCCTTVPWYSIYIGSDSLQSLHFTAAA